MIKRKGDGGNSVWPGAPYPLGATPDSKGTNFALFSANAEQVDLCLFDGNGGRETHRIKLPEYTDQVWHGYLPGVRPGQIYGYRVYGPYAPDRGHRFNHHKLLVDPYARNLTGRLVWNDANLGYDPDNAKKDKSFNRVDNAAFVPKAVVTDTGAGIKSPPDIPWQETVIYELHTRGMTMRHPDVEDEHRGTFAGLADEAVIDHLVSLGINTVELLPIHPFADERHLAERGMTNYWGYSPFNYFAPDPRYLATGGIDEFRGMTARFHEAGLQVVLDVVFNHTGEGDALGPTLSFRGIDNASYYHHEADAPGRYADHTGCGNSLDLTHPRVLQMVLDSLRYWVEDMHVDGFRFDLATTLARGPGGFEADGPFLSAVRQDPVLSRVKLIAEPWDLGPGGYRVGGFPPGWSEWNDKYRDTVRAFWKGDDGVLGDMASSLTGSSHLFAKHGRRPRASVNFVTAHDGFTLTDLVTYESKRNEANGENNRDGTGDNRSWNCGTEGPTDDPDVGALRLRQKRNLMATLMLSQGVPMVTAGDELGRTQGGNNNAYCQDNETSWIDWEGLDAEDRGFLEFVRRMIALRREHPAFRRPRFFQGRPVNGSQLNDITWLSPEGRELKGHEWGLAYARCFGFHLGGDTGTYLGRDGRDLADDRFVVLMNAHNDAVPFILPEPSFGEAWREVFDTARPESADEESVYRARQTYRLEGHSMALLIHDHGDGA